jgi:hypothetical protein
MAVRSGTERRMDEDEREKERKVWKLVKRGWAWELNPSKVTQLVTQSQFRHCTQGIPIYGN